MNIDYIFLLGREPELSLAEIRSVFWDVALMGNCAIVKSSPELLQENQNGLWGVIKIAKVDNFHMKKQEILPYFTQKIREKSISGKKIRIALDVFSPALSSLVFKAKDTLKSEWHSVRVVQHDAGRVKTATTLHEKLISQGIECMIIPNKAGDYIAAETVWVQDIDAYSKRDMDRERSMVVGMMPPKIAQIMINLATKWDKNLSIYDCFCWLGTTMIEAWHAGYRHLIASDISPEMVRTTTANTQKISALCEVFVHDARKIHEKNIHDSAVIVTEWMLGKNFTPSTIQHSLVLSERNLLTSLYTDFLSSSWDNSSIKNLVFCLPFWNIWNETIFMPDISQMNKKWLVDDICRVKKRFLQHSRPGQSVGREIVVLKRG